MPWHILILLLKNILNNSISHPTKMWHMLFTVTREKILAPFFFVLVPQKHIDFLNLKFAFLNLNTEAPKDKKLLS